MIAAGRLVALAGLALVLLPAAAAGQAPAGRLSARIQAIDTPSALARGEAAAAILDVRNTGTEPWPAAGPVRLSYHWRRMDGADAGAESPRSQLPVVVPPGGSSRVCALVVAPDVAGELRLDWELVKEGEAWFGARDPASVLRQPVTVRDAPAAEASAPAGTWRVASWLIVTLAHVIVSAWWATRPRPRDLVPPIVDARVFDTVLFAIGTLHGLLFLASASTGLPHPRGLLWVAAFDAVVAISLLATRRREAAGDPVVEPRPAWTPHAIVLAALQAAGGLALLALAVSWLRAAARSLHVTGSDAAHYHAPHAVNLALGTSPFDLLPTPHLYPMGTSLLGAWFILPFGDPLLIDVAMLAAAALLAAALSRAFSAATGLPGFAWTPWLLLALLAPPLFQAATLFSSDLPFAAAFAAAGAQLLTLGVRGDRPLDTRDAIRTGLAFGLLCGVKTTGAPATALLLLAAATVWAIRRWRRRGAPVPAAAPLPHRRRLAASLVAVGLAAFLAGGGSWLVRNQVRYGSPVAPNGLRVLGLTIFPGETMADGAMYYSVAGDLARPGGYPLRARVSYFGRRLIGPVGGPIALVLFVLVADVAVTRWRRRGAGPPDPRLGLVLGFAAVAVVFVWLLVHAPWTSLDWTRGQSLRYALPILVGVAFLAFLGLFPRQFAWYDDAVTAAAGGAILAAGAVTVLLGSRAALPASSPDPVPGLDGVSLAVATAALIAIGLGWRRPAVRYAGLAALTVGAWPVAARLASHDAALLAAPRHEAVRQAGCAAAGLDGDLDPHRALFAAIVAAERARGEACPARRVFLASRFDQPLELQTLPYTTRVFDVRRSETGRLDAGGAACDYLVMSRAELATDRGAAALRQLEGAGRWQPAAERGGYAAFAARR